MRGCGAGSRVRRMRRLLFISLLALLVLPAAALAAPAKISPKAAAVTAGGITTVEVANPNAYVLRGKAVVIAGQQIIATKTVKLRKRSVSTIRLRLGAKALEALRTAGDKATISLKLRGRGGAKSTAKRKVTLRAPAAPGAPVGDGAAGQGSAPAPAPTPAAPASSRWVGRMGGEGAYDDLEFTIDGNQLTFTKMPLVPIYCFEMGGWYRNSLSFDLFNAPGPWTIGTDGLIEAKSISANTLVTGGERTMNHTVKNVTVAANQVTGTMGMSFSTSRLDIFDNYNIVFINCSGSQSFDAVPA